MGKVSRNKKKYRIKPLPVALLTLGIVFVILLILWMTTRNSSTGGDVSVPKDSSQPSSGLSSAQSSSDASSVSALSSAESSSSTQPSSVSYSSNQQQPPSSILPLGSVTDWNLILLNHMPPNKIDGELDISKTKFDSQWVDSRAAESYTAMRSAASKAGITLFLRSGYRSIATQKVLFDNDVAEYRAQGYSLEEAAALTKQYRTEPGHSEHHTGLAFDIITPQYHNDIYTLDERFASTKAYEWLRTHCAEYGFILRYPKDKTDITQINFEPWHYRYVGKAHAAYIMSHALTLEEYLELFDQ